MDGSTKASSNNNNNNIGPDHHLHHRRRNNNLKLQLQNAVQLSKLATSNITSAHLACQEWKEIFRHRDDNDDDDSISKMYDRGIIGLCYTLYASCLVRIGQDEEAIDIYNIALQYNDVLDKITLEKAMLGKAQALQRCLRYDDAMEQYRNVVKNSEQQQKGILGAATCAIRLQKLCTAKEILNEYHQQQQQQQHPSSNTSPNVLGMLGTLEYIDTGSLEKAKLLLESSVSVPLYRWIGRILLAVGGQSPPKSDVTSYSKIHDPFFDLITMNLCPFDDPNLIILDDKILLHKLLSSRKEICSRFWPEGYITSDDMTKTKPNEICTDEPESIWLSKRRFGYGSHGNLIFKLKDQGMLKSIGMMEDPVLLQRMVDPLLLLDGYKFSLRIYVVFFHPKEKAYTSKVGLVKLASARATTTSNIIQDKTDPRIHMTNSGRESSMQQRDLQYLSVALQQSGHSYEAFWNRIKSVVKDVFHVYHQHNSGDVDQLPEQEFEKRRRQLGLPKILGFDFVVDETCQPWLVEINRFPGLEPRDDIDRQVKQQVVRDAWRLAGERLGHSTNPLSEWIDDIPCEEHESQLEEI